MLQPPRRHNTTWLILAFVGVAVLISVGIMLWVGFSKPAITTNNNNANSRPTQNSNTAIAANANTSASTSTPAVINPASPFTSPLVNPKARITKKPFGIYITPKTSPVQPERFTGYHTGVDFETTPDELNATVQVKAFCDGKFVYKQWVSGYGGVAIQSCTVNSQAVTVLYGHLNVDSITHTVGEILTQGAVIGNLGDAYSHQTDGERKHLHFSIHKGSAIELKGYVQNKADLANWLDPANYLY